MVENNINNQEIHIVIVGGGVIGASIAYYLCESEEFKENNKRPIKISLIEQDFVACSSSGKAGGFLACGDDWPTTCGEMGKESFQLHEQLADILNGEKKYGYRKMETYFMVFEEESDSEKPNIFSRTHASIEGDCDHEEIPEWLCSKRLKKAFKMGTVQNTAQVHPFQFTNTLMEHAMSKGVEYLQGTVVDIRTTNHGNEYMRKHELQQSKKSFSNRPCSQSKKIIYYTKSTHQKDDVDQKDSDSQLMELKCDHVVLAMGSWTNQFLNQLQEKNSIGRLPRAINSTKVPWLSPYKAHSIILNHDTGNNLDKKDRGVAIFAHINMGEDTQQDFQKEREPEFYARPDATIYMCGYVDTTSDLPPRATQVFPNEDSQEELARIFQFICPSIFKDSKSNQSEQHEEYKLKDIKAIQACFIPQRADGESKPYLGCIDMNDHDDHVSSGLWMATGHGVWGILFAPITGKWISEMILQKRKREFIH